MDKEVTSLLVNKIKGTSAKWLAEYACRNVAKFDKNYFHSIKIYLHLIKIFSFDKKYICFR